MEKLADWHEKAAEATRQHGSPLYVYDAEFIARRVQEVKQATNHFFGLRYAMKTNPNPWLIAFMRDQVESIDVSSSGELNNAVSNGWKGDDIEFTGPAKTYEDLVLAVEHGVESIVVEDLSEAVLLNDISAARNLKSRILVRIAPEAAEQGFGVRLAGRPTQFGVEESRLGAFIDGVSSLEHVHLDGFHIYSGSQCLDDEALAHHFTEMWRIFQRAIDLYGQPISELVFGAGMGIPYHDGDDQLSLSLMPEAAKQIAEEVGNLSFPVKCFIELGRYLVGEAGVFITKVIRVKESKTSQFVVCDGGMNNNLGACGHMGGVAHRHYSMAKVAIGREAEVNDEALQTYRVVGPLCTAIDTLAQRVKLPTVSSGDYIMVSCGGSYGPSASPLFFISHSHPKEVVWERGVSGGETLRDITWIPGGDI